MYPSTKVGLMELHDQLIDDICYVAERRALSQQDFEEKIRNCIISQEETDTLHDKIMKQIGKMKSDPNSSLIQANLEQRLEDVKQQKQRLLEVNAKLKQDAQAKDQEHVDQLRVLMEDRDNVTERLSFFSS